ncbi:MAG: sulfatase [Opitutaceae bacterium]
MKTIMVMFDSLNRHMLPPYGCDWVHAPNFRRLAERTVTFDRSYVCSMPCMPARRDLHTGRPNFLHRSWGPIEPFDDSVPEILKANGVHTHLVTDHYHYFEEGAGNYHTRYSTWEFFRGQEGDPWVGQVAPPEVPESIGQNARTDFWHQQDWKNRKVMPNEEDQPQSKTFKAGIDFIRRNRDEDNWFLQIETFDPHEPFFSNRKFKDLYAAHYDRYQGPHFDWPPYAPVTEGAELVEHIRHENAALISMCDAKMGDVLDVMDEQSLWEDTQLIVWTDHGFLLGEHDCWAKCWMPFYEEVAHTPFFIWDPRSGKRGERRRSLVQPSIDLGPTLLDFFGLEPTIDMVGKSLKDTVAEDAPVRETAIFGMFGSHVNITDGRYVYMRGTDRSDRHPLYEYTLMPTHMRHTFPVEELQGRIGLAEPFSFTKGCRTLKIDGGTDLPGKERVERDFSTRLYDLEFDPGQRQPVENPAAEERLEKALVDWMRSCDAPSEQYVRLGLKSF